MSGTAPGTRQPAFRAPSGDGGALIAPSPGEWDRVLAENRTIREQWRYDVQGRPLDELARQARRDLLWAAVAYTRRYRNAPSPADDAAPELFLAGHQPELFHPGVWLKNFVLGALAQQRGAVAVNLLIDNDTVKGTSLKVPTGVPETPRLTPVPFDAAGEPVPYEERRVVNGALFRSFGRRAAGAVRSLVPDPMVERLWPLACQRAREEGNLGLALAQARHTFEGRWGLKTLEVPQSRVCAGTSFRWFAVHLLAQLPRFHKEYNAAVAHYRRRHGVRSAAHPFPDLAGKDGWLEAPFWIWTTTHPRRRPLFAAFRRGRVIVSDGESLEIELPVTAEGDGAAAVERLCALESSGVKVRSRALTTTLWARLALSDLFVHGIGGAKYDEVTDRLFERFLGLPAPRLMVVSGTLLLPVRAPAASVDEQRELKQRLWQLRHHPERFLEENLHDGQGEHNEPWRLIAEKRRWIETPQTRENARRRCRAIREINVALQPYISGRRARTHERLGEVNRALEAARLLRWREFGFCLHPEDSLRRFLDRVLGKAAATCSNELTVVR